MDSTSFVYNEFTNSVSRCSDLILFCINLEIKFAQGSLNPTSEHIPNDVTDILNA